MGWNIKRGKFSENVDWVNVMCGLVNKNSFKNKHLFKYLRYY